MAKQPRETDAAPLTRIVRVREGVVLRDGERYGPGQRFECDEGTYQHIRHQVDLLQSAPDAEPEPEAQPLPESLIGVTAPALRAMTRDDLRELAAEVGVRHAASMTKDPLIDALVKLLPEDAR